MATRDCGRRLCGLQNAVIKSIMLFNKMKIISIYRLILERLNSFWKLIIGPNHNLLVQPHFLKKEILMYLSVLHSCCLIYPFVISCTFICQAEDYFPVVLIMGYSMKDRVSLRISFLKRFCS